MKQFFHSLQVKLCELLTPVPEIEQEYVDKVVFLLRRDFTTTEQNQILLSIATKLSKLREKDMKAMEKEYATLQEDHNILKGRMVIV